MKQKTINPWLVIILPILFSSIACAKEPKIDHHENPHDDGQNPASISPSPDEHDKVHRMASVYQGRSLAGLPCTLFISTKKEIPQGNGSVTTTETPTLAKLGYTVHGLKPLDVVVDFYTYNPYTNRFFDRNSNEPGTNLILLSILAKNEEEVKDPNKLLEYEQKGLLVQSLRIDFQDNKKDPERAVINIEHSVNEEIHYDKESCQHLQLIGTREVEFDVSGFENHDNP